MPRLLFLIFVFSAFNFFSGASVPAKKISGKAVLQVDTSTIKVRSFNQTDLKKYSVQSAFNYSDNYKAPSLWSTFWSWFWDKINAFLLMGKNGPLLVLFLEILLFTLGVGTIIFIILRLAGVDVLNIFRGKSATGQVPYSESVENIHQINFDEAIENAVAQHNYRLAVRLLYLKTLKQLSDTGQIHWEINKTNNDYVNELTLPEQREAFHLLTRQFEYIWYGEFVIDVSIFNNVSLLFKNFKVK